MAGIITISKGHDASYPWKQIGTKTGPAADVSSKAGVGYYLSPAERGGEPAGTWTGRGVAELGLTSGEIVNRAVFEPMYGRHIDPRDPTGETRLGRAPGKYKTADETYAAMLDAEPAATAERREQLMIEAKAQVRTPDLYWDATFSVSKSISLFHASALANAAAAAQQRDDRAATAWQRPHPDEAAASFWPDRAASANGADAAAQPTLPGMAPQQLPGGSRAKPRQAASPKLESDRLAILGLTPETVDAEIPAGVRRRWRNGAAARRKLEALGGLMLPADEPDHQSPLPAWPEPARRGRRALIQPPHQEVPPAAQVLESSGRAHGDPEREAG